MYRCHVQFYLLTHKSKEFAALKSMPPLENFTHTFAESGSVEESLLRKADVILADLREQGEETLKALSAGKREDAQLILMTTSEQAASLALPLPALAGGIPPEQRRLADQPVFGGDHQPHPQPDLV